MSLAVGSSPIPEPNLPGRAEKKMLAQAANCSPPAISVARKQITSPPVGKNQEGSISNRGEHANQRSKQHDAGFISSIVSLFKNSRSQTQEHNPALEPFQTEIKNLSDAVTKGDKAAMIEGLYKFNSAYTRHSLNLPLPDKERIAQAVVDRVLLMHADLQAKNPNTANEFINHYFSKVSSGRNVVTIKALLLSQGLNITRIDAKSAKILFEAAMLNLVKDFLGVSPQMLTALKDLARSSQLDRSDLESHIAASIGASEFDLANALIELNHGQIPNSDLEIARAIDERDLSLVNLLIKHDNTALQKLITKCVDGNLEGFLKDILTTTGHSLTPNETTRFSHQVHEQGNLSFMKLLNPNWKEDAAKLFTSIPAEAKADKLTHYFLNSDIAEAKELASLLQQEGKISPDQFRRAIEFQDQGGRLIARFPSAVDQKAMHAQYGKNFANYEQQQLAYGNNRYGVVNQTLSEVKAGKLSGNVPSLESVYIKLRGGVQAEGVLWRDGIAHTPIGKRYTPFKRFAIEKLQQGRSGEMGEVLRRNDNMAQITYQTARLTTFAPIAMRTGVYLAFYHTAPLGSETDPRWLEQLGISEDWKELIQMRVDVNNPDSLKAFKEKTADFYWKGVQLMPTDSGNSQTMLELHYILYQLHDLKAPAPSRTAILPDCIALCSTPAEFRQRYLSCWDFS